MQAKFLFGDIVVVQENLIGIVLKTWYTEAKKDAFYYEVYVRDWNSIEEFGESEIERYRIRPKELSTKEIRWQNDKM